MKKFFIFILFALAFAYVNAQFEYVSDIRPPYELGEFYQGDLDNNGQFDIATSNYVLMNPMSSDSYFFDLPGNVTGEIADFDNNGWNDLVLYENGESTLFLNYGNMNFVESDLPYMSSQQVHTTDIDDDGDIDMFVNGYWYENDGNAVFVAQLVAGTGDVVYCFDFDVDGLKDIVYTMINDIGWRKNLGDGIFEDFTTIVTPGEWIDDYYKKWDAIDYDHDNDLDLIYADYNNVVVYDNMGDMTFDIDPDLLFQNSQEVRNLYHNDYDLDGDDDIFFTDHVGDLYFTEDNYPFTFTVPSFIADLAGSFRVGNIDSDEYPDILTVVSGEVLHFFQGDGTFSFSGSQPLHANMEITGIGSDDMNDDGLVDILFTTNYMAGYFLQNGLLNFGAEHIADYNALNSNTHFWCDINEDGHRDLFDWSNGLIFLVNDGMNQFIPSAEITSCLCNGDFFMCDLNGDGHDDLVNFNYYESASKFSLNNGDGQFTMWTELESSKIAGNSDVDSDGDMDLLSRYGYLLNDGNANFTLVQIPSFLNINDMSRIKSTDLDGDGYDEFIYALNGIWSYSFLDNGTFEPSPQLIYPFDVNAILLSDFDLDGDKDIIAHGDVELYVFENINGVFPAPNDLNYELEFSAWTAIDMDDDGDEDLVISGHEGSYPNTSSLQWFENQTNSGFQISGNVFLDENESGTLDVGESGFDAVQLSITPGGALSYTGNEGNYSFSPDAPGNFSVAAGMNSNWINTTPSSFDVALTADEPISPNNNFGFIPVNEETQVTLTFNTSIATCSQQQYLWIGLLNTGSTTPQATVTLTLDENILYISAFPEPTSVIGQVITWDFSELNYFSQQLIAVMVEYPSADFLGDEFYSFVEAQITDGLENPLLLEDEYQLLLCAYDPNFKEEHTGFTDAGYVNGNDRLEYTIHFQNTGNAPATNVVIRDQLSDQLDWNSLELISWSHPLQANIDEEGTAVFSFVNIMLPDSADDFQGSQGFVRFSILPDVGLANGSSIGNDAHILFDYNPAILTNEISNTIFDCDSYSAEIITNQEMDCFLQSYIFSLETEWNESISWWANDELISNDISAEPTQTGTYWLSLEISNPLCGSRSDSLLVTIGEAVIPEISTSANEFCDGDVVILQSNFEIGNTWTFEDSIISNEQEVEVTQGGTFELVVQQDECFSDIISITLQMLGAPEVPVIDYFSGSLQAQFIADVSYQWYLDGNPVEGATLNYYLPLESGEYSVQLTNTNGCSVVSDTVVVFVNIEEQHSTALLIYPNPADDFCWLELENPNRAWIEIFSMDSRLVQTHRASLQMTKLDIATLPSGVYHVSVREDSGATSNVKLVVER